VADLFVPVSGEIIAANEAVTDSPELVNSSPMDEGWLLKIRLSDAGEADVLLDASAYQDLIGG
jgi:glycine cleavage system H protein